MSKYLAPVAPALEPFGADTIKTTEDLASADIAPWQKLGSQGSHPRRRYYFNYHHTAADTLDKVNPHHLAENAAVIAVTAYALADALTPPPALSVRTRERQ